MSYCLNPKCPNPSDPSNANRSVCRHCGSQLLLEGRYRIIQPMGGGGFGRTFEVDDRGSRKVLKVLLKQHPKAVALFKQEADVLSKLRHPGIPVVDADGYFTFLANGAKDPLHCLVMEKIEGPNLQDWIKSRGNQPLSQEQAVDWLKQLSEILANVHDKQYFHRDIKPHNIMVKPNGQLVLIDFGTAREVSGTYLAKVGQGQNVTGIVSPGYTPPEQTNGKAVPQSDFFALGRTFVYLLTGKPPTAFPENPRTGKLLWRKGAPHISDGLASIIDYLMATFPGNRPQTPQAILQCIAETDFRTPDQQPQAPTGGTNTKGGGTKGPNSQIKSKGGQNSAQGLPSAAEGKATGKKGSKSEKQKNQSVENPIKLWPPPKGLLVGGAVLLVAWGISQLYGLARYRLFPTSPIWLIRSFSSAEFLLKTYVTEEGNINAISVITVDGQEFVFSGGSEKIEGWNLNTDRSRPDISDEASSLVVIPKDPILVRGGTDGNVRLWNWVNRSRMLTLTAHKGNVGSIALSPNRRLLATGGNDRLVKLWLFQTNKLLRTFTGHTGKINSMVFTPDGQTLVTASEDRSIKLWNVSTGDLKATLQGHQEAVNAIAISADGQMLVSVSDDKTVRIWDLRTAKPRVLRGHEEEVKSVAISTDGKTVVTGSKDILVWDVKTGTEKQRLLGHLDFINSIAFQPINLKNPAEANHLTIISGSLDKTIKVWRIPKN